jgi:hypothetical protein
MAVSVLSATGLVTTQKAAAGVQLTPSIVVTYRPGAMYKYAPWQFNYHRADFNTWQGTNIQHSETSTGGRVFSSITTTQQQAGESFAEVATNWQLNLNGADWNTVKDKPCTLTVTLYYRLYATGTSNIWAYVGWGSWFAATSKYDIMYGNDRVHSKQVWTTKTVHTTVGSVFYAQSNGKYYGGGEVETATQQYPAGVGHAWASAVVGSMELGFPAA